MTAISQKHWTGDVGELLRVGEGFVLADVDTRSTPGYLKDKVHAAEDLVSGAVQLDEYQERLFAQSRVDATNASVLLVQQAMDSAGKGGIVRHVVGSSRRSSSCSFCSSGEMNIATLITVVPPSTNSRSNALISS